MCRKLILPWKGVSIKISYVPDYSKAVREQHGYQLAHIEVRADSPLPITKTGYHSMFLPNKEVEEAGGAVALVNDLLNESAKSKEWQEYQKRQNQLKLF